VEGLGAKERQAVLQRMDELAQGKLEPLVSTRFLFQRNGRR